MLDEYRAGKFVEVWEKIRAIGDVRGTVFDEAYAVAREMMGRVRDNVLKIRERLAEAGYEFAQPAEAYVPPPANQVEMTGKIEEQIGPMPLALRAFYEVVGSVNFCQSIRQLVHWRSTKGHVATNIEKLGAEDPLYVVPLSRIHDDLMFPKRRPGVEPAYVKFDPEQGRWYCWLGPDELTKAYQSGGDDFHAFIPDRAPDFRASDLFVCAKEDDEPAKEWFVDYLRQSIKGGGFRGRWDQGTCVKRAPEGEVVAKVAAGLIEF